MRILLIGAAGQLGQDLLPMLEIRRHEVKALTHEELEICSAEAVRQQIANAGLRVVREELHVTSTVRKLPAPLGRWLGSSPLTQDALISNIEYVLAPA